MRSEEIIRAERVSRSYLRGEMATPALPPVTVSIRAGEFVVISGPSGSGKSTLLNLLSGLDQPSTGTVTAWGENLNELSSRELARLRNDRFGFVFQTPHALPDRSVLENVLLPLQYAPGCNQKEAVATASDLIEYVGLGRMRDRLPSTLSGGELQRLVFARALIRDPQVIFADEPTGSLDAGNSKILLDLLSSQNQQGRTVVMVTHDRFARSYGSKQIELDKFQ